MHPLTLTLGAARPRRVGRVATGVFFDSSAGDRFSSLSYPASDKLIVSDDGIVFSSSQPVSLDVRAKDSLGNTLSMAFDDIVVDASYTVASFPAADAAGMYTGFLGGVLGLSAGELKAHPASKSIAFARLFNTGSPLTNDTSGFPFSSPFSVRSKLTLSGTTLKHEVTYQSTQTRTLTLTLGYSANSFELPRLFQGVGVRLVSGDISIDSLRVQAQYPNARFAFVGDSLTQGRFAALYADAFAQKVRADYPGEVLVAGAPSATTEAWLVPIRAVCDMQPKRVFVMLGTNDLATNRPLASVQADYAALMFALAACGAVPVALTCPPMGAANGAALNAWAKSQWWAAIDTYSLLGGGGNTLLPAYNSGDGVHLTTAGNAVVYTAVKDHIVSNSL